MYILGNVTALHLQRTMRYAKQKWRVFHYQTWRNLYLTSSNFWVSVIRVISLPYIFSPMSDSSHGAHIRSLVPSFEFLSRIFTLCHRHGREYIMQSLIYRPRAGRFSLAEWKNEFTRMNKWKGSVSISRSFKYPSRSKFKRD